MNIDEYKGKAYRAAILYKRDTESSLRVTDKLQQEAAKDGVGICTNTDVLFAASLVTFGLAPLLEYPGSRIKRDIEKQEGLPKSMELTHLRLAFESLCIGDMSEYNKNISLAWTEYQGRRMAVH